MKTDLDNIRELLERLGIPYTTVKKDNIIYISIKETPAIMFSFMEDGEATGIYNYW